MRTQHLPCRLAILASALFGGLSSSTQAQLTDLGAHVLTECAAPGGCLEFEGFGGATAAGDFNDDGFADLAVGVADSSPTIGGATIAGAVHVYYGSPGGLTSVGEQQFDQDTPGIPGESEVQDLFGRALAVGDFNLDGFADLAIGIPREDVSTGAVVVLFGSSDGLRTSGSRLFTQANLPPGSAQEPDSSENFGEALASAANGELAIGVPGEGVFIEVGSAGLVHRLRPAGAGQPFGSTLDVDQDDFLGVCAGSNGSQDNERWGDVLVFGFFGPPSLSLVVSGQREILAAGGSRAGRVFVMTGEASACFDQNTPGMPDSAEASDGFGAGLAVGDFNSDGFEDLAIGIPGETVVPAGNGRVGMVQVLFGSTGGLTISGNRTLFQSAFPLGTETGDIDDRFGAPLASGDFDADGFDDLAIGVPTENVGAAVDAGTVNVAYGRSSGFDEDEHQTFNSNFPAGMPDSPNTGDRFGAALATGDFDGNGSDDLAIGMPGEGLGDQAEAGGVTVLYGLLNATEGFGTAFFGSNTTVSEAEGNRIFVAFRDGGAVLAASASHSRQGGSATPGVDFSYTPGTMNWVVGDVDFDFSFVHIIADTLDEGDETVRLQLTNPSLGLAIGSPATITMTIEDDDEGGSIQFTDVFWTVFEGEQSTASVLVSRTDGAASGVTVQYTTLDGTAIAGQDYVAQSGTLSFAAGQTEAVITVELIDDVTPESNENFTLDLSSPAGGANLGKQTSAIVVIVDKGDSDRIFGDGFD
jgi:hypothetical protein